MATLHSYYRSSCSYRVRIALNWKKIKYETVPVNLLLNEQSSPEYLRLNPLGRVPMLEIGGRRLTQSVAILEYLEQVYPQNALLPSDPLERAEVRTLVQIIASDIQPLQNLAVLRRLDSGVRNDWAKHFIESGLGAFEKTIKGHSGRYCHGDTVSMADVCLVPQLYNARRFNVDISQFPLISAIEQNLMSIPEFAAASPERQPDAK